MISAQEQAEAKAKAKAMVQEEPAKEEEKPKEEKMAVAAAPAPGPAAVREFGDFQHFGQEDTAKELTEASIAESDKMVDQIERSVVAETKRAVFRSLTRLRGAAITSFDGMAHSQTANIDAYTASHRFRDTHDVKHLAEEEQNFNEWAFPPPPSQDKVEGEAEGEGEVTEEPEEAEEAKRRAKVR